MTVRQLIAALQAVDPDCEVWLVEESNDVVVPAVEVLMLRRGRVIISAGDGEQTPSLTAVLDAAA